MWKFIKLLILLAAVLLTLAFALLNRSELVLVNYYLGETELPLILLVMICLLVGWVLGLLSLSAPMVKLRYRNNRLAREHKVAEAEVQNLRQLPLQDKY